jgi:hypothetical protein
MARRWGVPVLLVGVLLAAAIVVVLLPVKAEDHECGKSSLAIVRGAEVPEELSEECHKEARIEMLVASFPAGAAVVAGVLSVALLRGAPRKD